MHTAAAPCACRPTEARCPPAPLLPRPPLQPDNWQQDAAWLATWVAAHAEAAKTQLKKPLVLEEVGCALELLEYVLWCV